MYRILIIFLMPCLAFAAERVSVLALFPGKAMLDVDGQRKVLAQGETHPAGVRLLDANAGEARVLLNGREVVLTLGRAVNARYAVPETNEIRLLKQGNAFYLDGLINGQTARMLVDTGATLVAISETDAQRLGIPYVLQGKPTVVSTASGVVKGYGVELRSLKIGTRSFDRVRAVVVEGDSPRHVLLGMNVLGLFHIEHRGNLMVLSSKY